MQPPEHLPHDARAVANLMLDRADGLRLRLSHIALQKLLFFAHGRYRLARGRPLVSGLFEAWQFGPVHPLVYQSFKSCGAAPVGAFRATSFDYRAGEPRPLEVSGDPEAEEHVESVLVTMGRMPVGRLVELSHAPLTYNPVRSQALDILNAQSRMLGLSPETPLETIVANIERGAKSPAEAESNEEVARLLFEDVRKRGFRTYATDFTPFTTRPGDSAAYWLKAVMVSPEGELLVPLPDFRRTYRLSSVGRRFAASVMHQAIRVQNPTDFGAARLGVFHFPQASTRDPRTVSFEVVSDEGLYTAEELASMIAETFALWDEVLEERAEEVRKTGTGGPGSLF